MYIPKPSLIKVTWVFNCVGIELDTILCRLQYAMKLLSNLNIVKKTQDNHEVGKITTLRIISQSKSTKVVQYQFFFCCYNYQYKIDELVYQSDTFYVFRWEIAILSVTEKRNRVLKVDFCQTLILCFPILFTNYITF